MTPVLSVLCAGWACLTFWLAGWAVSWRKRAYVAERDLFDACEELDYLYRVRYDIPRRGRCVR